MADILFELKKERARGLMNSFEENPNEYEYLLEKEDAELIAEALRSWLMDFEDDIEE